MQAGNQALMLSDSHTQVRLPLHEVSHVSIQLCSYSCICNSVTSLHYFLFRAQAEIGSRHMLTLNKNSRVYGK